MVKSYIKKPVAIEAVVWGGDNLLEIIRFTGQKASAMDLKWEDYEALVKKSGLKIFTLEDSHMASVGDYIIKGIEGECYPCKPDIFEATYYTQEEFVRLNQ